MTAARTLPPPSPRARAARVVALSPRGDRLALREGGDLRLIDAAGEAVDLEGAAADDFAFDNDRLWVAAGGALHVYGAGGVAMARCPLGAAAALHPLPSGDGVLVAGEGESSVARLEEGAIAFEALDASEPGDTVLASLGGVRTLRGRGRQILVTDPGRELHRLRLPGAGEIVGAAEILGGGALAVASQGPEGSAIDVVRAPGGLVHHIELPETRAIRFAARRGVAVAVTEEGELVAVNLRFGRVSSRTPAPLADCHIDLDEAAAFVALAGYRAGSEKLSVFRVGYGELFGGAAIRLEAAEPEKPAPPPPRPRLAVRRPAAPVAETPAIPRGPLAALVAPRPPRPGQPPESVAAYDGDGEHLGELLELACARAARAIAAAWDRGALVAYEPGLRPGEPELRGLAGERGAASDELERWSERVAELEARCEARARATLAGGGSLALLDLAAQLSLSPAAVRVLLTVAAPALCPRAARLYAVLADDTARPACDRALVCDILGAAVAAELRRDEVLLRRGAVIEGPGDRALFAPLGVDDALLDRLRGSAAGAVPGAVARLVRVDRSLEDLGIPAAVVAEIVEYLQRPASRPVRLVVRGRSGLGGTRLLAALAARATMPLAVVDAARLPGGDEFAAALRRELIRADLRGALACVAGLEGRRADVESRGAHLAEVFRTFEGPLAIRTDARFDVPLDPGFFSVSLPALSESERLARWRAESARLGIEARGVDELARRSRLGAAAIDDVVAEVAASAPEGDATAALEAAARQRIESRLGRIATRIERLARWEQLALPPETLDSIKELIARARHRRTVFETWGLEERVTSSGGLTALFSGAPGTGKTMVAGVVARELGLDLYRVDLASLVSKWIGETEKNLARLFDAAEDGQAVLLFDEADSLFARRTEVKTSNDRHANMETGYLLQRLDSFDGVAILTTNLERSIDRAFARRLSLRVRFPFPDTETRVALWRAHVPEALPTAGELDFEALARKFPMTGGYIRNSVVRAAFLAAGEGAALSQEHLERAVHLEYRETGKLSASGRLE